MPVSTMQTAFSGGELSPALHARVDIQKYITGAKLLSNFYVLAGGGITNRPGTKYVCEVKDSTKATRLIEFAFNTEQTYVLEFGDQYMRVIKDGGQVLKDGVAITAISTAADAVFTAPSHGLVVGKAVFITSVVGMTEVNGEYFTVTEIVDTDNFKVGLDTTGYTAYSSGGTMSEVFELDTPYLEADLDRLKFTQSADVMTITHNGYAPRDLSRYDHDDWSLDTISFAPTISPPTGVGASYSGSDITGTTTYVVTAVGDVDDNYQESIASSEASANGTLAAADDQVTVTWSAVAGASTYNIYKKGNGLYGFVGSAKGTSFIDDNIAPDYLDSPPESRDPFDAPANYPAVVEYYQQRKAFANTDNKPQGVWMTQSANYENMSVSTPSKDDDAVTFSMAARQVNEIRHLIPLEDLIILTSGGEWLASGTENNVITPSSIRVDPQSYYGSSWINPIVSGKTILFVQDHQQIVRDFSYTLEYDSYSGNELTVLARHLFEDRTIVDWTYALSPHSLVWTVMSDGTLTCLTFQKEHEVWAWSRHSTPNGRFESVCSVSEGTEDAVYFVVRRLINGTWKRYIERLQTRVLDDIRDSYFVDCGLSLDLPLTIVSATKADPCVLEVTGHGLTTGDKIDVSIDGLFWKQNEETDAHTGMSELHNNRYSVTVIDADHISLQDQYTGTDIDSSAYSTYYDNGVIRKCETTVENLDHLNGETVTILADGNVLPTQVVSNGSITITNPASRIHIGIGYVSSFESLESNISTRQGSSQSKKRRVAEVTMRLEETRGLQVGPSATRLKEVQEMTASVLPGQPIPWFTGDKLYTMTGQWSDGGRIYARQVHPLPVTILGLMPSEEVAG